MRGSRLGSGVALFTAFVSWQDEGVQNTGFLARRQDIDTRAGDDPPADFGPYRVAELYGAWKTRPRWLRPNAIMRLVVRRLALVLLAVAAAAGSASAGAQGLPTQGLPAVGSGLASDGEGRVAVFASDGGSVGMYDAVRRRSVGVAVALPRNEAGGLPRLRTIGTWGTAILLAGYDPARTVNAVDDRVALVDVATGSFRWLCATFPPVVGPQVEGLGSCPNENGKLGLPNSGYAPTSVAAGSRWLWVSFDRGRGGPGYSGLVRWSLAGGRFTWRWPSARERRSVRRRNPPGEGSVGGYRSAGVPIDLGYRGVRDHRRWGFGHAVIEDQSQPRRSGIRVLVRRTSDSRAATPGCCRPPPRRGPTTPRAVGRLPQPRRVRPR